MRAPLLCAILVPLLSVLPTLAVEAKAAKGQAKAAGKAPKKPEQGAKKAAKEESAEPPKAAPKPSKKAEKGAKKAAKDESAEAPKTAKKAEQGAKKGAGVPKKAADAEKKGSPPTTTKAAPKQGKATESKGKPKKASPQESAEPAHSAPAASSLEEPREAAGLEEWLAEADGVWAEAEQAVRAEETDAQKRAEAEAAAEEAERSAAHSAWRKAAEVAEKGEDDEKEEKDEEGEDEHENKEDEDEEEDTEQRLKRILACKIDESPWREFRYAVEYAMHNDDNGDPLIDQTLRDYLADRTRDVSNVLDCNVGIVAAYYHLSQRVLRFRPYDLERAYGLLQLAMIFIFTLRNAVQIPARPAVEWQVSERDVIGQIRAMKPAIDARRDEARRMARPARVEDSYRDPNMRIAVVGICAYPADHPIALKDVTPMNREMYCQRHGYDCRMHFEHPIIGGNVHVQHSKLALVESYVRSGEFDWVAWFDCDSIIMNMDKTLDSIIYKYAQLPRTGSQPIEAAVVTQNLTGMWIDSFAGPNAPPDITIYEDGDSALRAEAPQFGRVDEGARVGDQVVLDFPGDGPLAADLSADGKTLRWENGAIWTRSAEAPDGGLCSNEGGCDLELHPDIDVLITEEGWGLSSANWLVRASDWTAQFLRDSFQTAHVTMPLFGDQDAMILLLQNARALDADGEPFDGHGLVVPQDAFNSYDALNAYTMRCRAFHEGDLLVTFPSCKDPISCNPLFEAAAEYAKDPKAFVYDPMYWAHIRLFGPESTVIQLYREHFT